MIGIMDRHLPAFLEHSPPPGTVHVIGASGRSGLALVRTLVRTGIEPVPVVRDAARWRAGGVGLAPRIADLHDAAAMRRALADATWIVCTAHARHAPLVIAAAPADARLLFLGSTRKFTRWPDAHGNGVLAGERALLESGRAGVILHPTMIYGAQGENNVRRLAALLRVLPVVPLPDGGRSLVQPIHQSDLTRAIVAALQRDWRRACSIVVAGPEAVRYRDFVAAIAQASGLPMRRVLPVPLAMMVAAAVAGRLIPGLPSVRPDEVRRLAENKDFDIGPMRRLLGVEPITLADGLAQTFAPTR